MDRIVIVGASQAGIGVAAELRRLGFGGAITVLGEEAHLPYQRPPLSKELLHEGGTATNLYLYPQAWYAEQSIALELGRRAISIERADKVVVAEGGLRLPYDHLVLATGARPRPLSLPGLEAAITLRDLGDARAIAGACKDWTSVAIVGGGFIGLEVASFLRAQGLDVTVIEAAPQLMGRVVSKPTAAFFAHHHRSAGTNIILSQTVLAGSRESGRFMLRLSNGDNVLADMVISAIGALANTDLASQAGLAVERGILVDPLMQTSDPAISAVGDCAEHIDSTHGRRVRLESVQNAVDQAKTLAGRLMGQAAPYVSLPWFWSTQGSAKLQIAGLALDETEDLVRINDSDTGRLAVFRYLGDRLVAVETVNLPGDHLLARRLLGQTVPVPRHLAADPSFNLRSLLQTAPSPPPDGAASHLPASHAGAPSRT
ncbi:MAG: NAD(P)/FAD-dependent oxidoreductase [Devosia sp.]